MPGLKLLEIHIRELITLLSFSGNVSVLLRALHDRASFLDVGYDLLKSLRELLEVFLVQENLMFVVCEASVLFVSVIVR